MDKVMKREREFRFNDPCQPCREGIGCDECDHLPKEGSEKPVEGVSDGGKDSPQQSDSRDLFFNSYPIEDMSPAQRKHFKRIMRIEVRG